MKKNYLLLILLVSTLFSWGQQQRITGNVADSQSMPLAGVNILVQGTTSGTQTNFDGNYSISVSQGQTLVFSYLGFKTKTVVVVSQQEINVLLEEDTAQLEEVVVVGYGAQKKESLTASVTIIESQEIAKQPIVQTSTALVGLAPGLTAIESSGQPGAGATLRIRGVGSYSSNNSPLVIVDGVESSLNGIDPNDIESFSVLKDAGAAAIYGNRGSNGVILVTTKRGKEGKTEFTYNSFIGFNRTTDKIENADAFQYLEATGSDADAIAEYRANNAVDPDRFPNTDWVDLIFSEPGLLNYQQIGITSGNETVRVASSLSYQEEQGNIKGFGIDRINGRINTDVKVNDRFNIILDVNFRRSNSYASRAGLAEIVKDAYAIPSIYAAQYSNGLWSNAFNGGNPISRLSEAGNDETESNFFTGRLKVNFKPVEGLTLSALYSPQYLDSFRQVFSKQWLQYPEVDSDTPVLWSYGTDSQVELSQSNSRGFNQTFTATANYDRSFGDHNITALVGFEYVKYTSKSLSARVYDFVTDQFAAFSNANLDNDNISNSATQRGLQSYFSRINYDYKGKYLLEGVLRVDQTSRFAPGERTGYFPSISAGWVVSKESFFDNVGFIDFLKLRGSWGQLGNQDLRDGDGNTINFPYTSNLLIGGNTNFIFGNDLFVGAGVDVLPNPLISWETSESSNIGLDLRLFDNRLNAEIEYYRRDTKDLIGPRQDLVPFTVGLSVGDANVGSMRNSGIDLSIGWTDAIGELKYSISGNFSTLKNEVLSLGEGLEFLGGGTGASINRVGDPFGSIWGLVSEGLFQTQEEIDNAPPQFNFSPQPGDIRYADINSFDDDGNIIEGVPDGVVNNADRTIIGNPFPNQSFALNIGLEYKGFDLAFSGQGVANRDFRLTEGLVYPLFFAGNVKKFHLDNAWTPENTGAYYPRVQVTSLGDNNGQTSSHYVYDGGYFRLRNATLGYSLPDSFLDNIFINKFRMYVSAQNLFTIKFDKNLPEGVNPTAPNGTNGTYYPLTQKFVFGLNISF
ncbi:TonB-dependent receptor [Tamlana sp. 2201CG12-4]|uniref:SusC/RagA family TonB-linked outer membrane protein n=1 Tax=Tamlana sp. 2201CG12-4 TaxID=3112582 RepID=UPI002DBC4361|nr:TonB-dependent receptor [Tamlana sp. 2201CG12-4]MEC3908254.1 TonB-dependent receptor [Tamlana sp. 2201CG12-4]